MVCFGFLMKSCEATKHSHKYPTACQFVQRCFLGVLHFRTSLQSCDCHWITFSHGTYEWKYRHTTPQMQTPVITSILALTSKESPPTALHHQPNFFSLLFSFRDETQRYQKGTDTTTVFNERQKREWGQVTPSADGPVRSQIIQRRKTLFHRGWRRQN